MQSPLSIGKTVERYSLDTKLKNKLVLFDKHIWQDYKIKKLSDLLTYEKKYQDFSKKFDLCYDTEANEFSPVFMFDGEACLLQKGAFKRTAEIKGTITAKCTENGLNELETVVLKTFFAEISGLYRKDAYQFGIPPFVSCVCDILNNAIAKLPVYTKQVVRACHRYDKSDFKIGDIFTPGFCLTCSTDLNWKDESENRYKIQPLNEKQTKARSLYTVHDISEKQVTFLQNASFRIVAINDWGNDKKEFEMEEV